jgi:hypothetical protein
MLAIKIAVLKVSFKSLMVTLFTVFRFKVQLYFIPHSTMWSVRRLHFIYYKASDVWSANHSFLFAIIIAHHDWPIRDCVIAFVVEWWIRASAVSRRYVVPDSTERARLQEPRTCGQAGRRRVTGLWRVSSPPQDAVLMAAVQKNLFISVRELEAATCFRG